MSDQQVQTPPPHPYATPRRRPGRALAIAAMAIGLAALLTVAASPLTTPWFAVGGALFGVVAVALGVIALILRQPLAPAIVGLVAGVIAVVLTCVLGVVSLGAYLADTRSGSAQSGAAPAPHSESAVVAWPRNMATGGVVFAGPDHSVLRSHAPAPSAAPEPRSAEELDAPALIRVYQDYRCPYCASFEQANGETLASVLEQEAAVIEVHALTFLDRAGAGDAYSSRTAGALACLADAQPGAAWDANAALLHPDAQPAEGGQGPDNAAIIAVIERATGPLSDDARSCITEERFVPFAQALNEWVFANPVPHAADPELGVTGTPLVLVNGTPYPGDPADPRAFRAFLEQQGVALR